MKKIYEKDVLPLYEIFIDEDDNSGVSFVSLVDDPAIQMKGFCFDADYQEFDDYDAIPPCHPNCKCRIENGVWTTEPDVCNICLEKKAEWEKKKASRSSGRDRIRRVVRKGKGKFEMNFSTDDERQIVAGPALIPDLKIYRNDGKEEYYVTFTQDVIKQIVNKFSRQNNNRNINLNHTDLMSGGYIIGSWIVENSVYDKSKYYGFNDLPVGTWFIEVHVPDKKIWNNEVKEKGQYGFSIEGLLGNKLVDMHTVKPSIEEMIESLDELELMQLLKEVL